MKYLNFIQKLAQKRLNLAHQISYILSSYPFKGSNRLKNSLVEFIAPKPTGAYIFNSRYGFKILIDPYNYAGLEKAVHYFGLHEAGTISVMDKYLESGDIFIDAGASIGWMTLFAAFKEAYVYSFEPNTSTYNILKENIKLNNITNFEGYNLALGGSSHKAKLHYDGSGYRGGSSLMPRPFEVQEVEVITLDDFVQEKNIENVKMIKIDVEGYELEVLKGAKKLLSKKQVPIICIEYSQVHEQKNGVPTDIYEFILAVNNYKIYKLKRGNENISKLIEVKSTSDLPYHENLFCFLDKK